MFHAAGNTATEIKLLANENEAATSHDTTWQTENVDILVLCL